MQTCLRGLAGCNFFFLDQPYNLSLITRKLFPANSKTFANLFSKILVGGLDNFCGKDGR